MCSRFPGRLKWSDCGNMSASVRGTWRVARVFIKTRIVFCWKIVNHCRHRFKYRKYIRGVTAYKYIRCHAMACTSSGYRRLGYKIYNNNTFIEIPSVLYITYMVFHYNSIPFRCSFFPGCGSSSVIEIVKVKYNRIDIKMWLVSISFIINIEILTKFYTKYMIFNYNTISCRCSFFPGCGSSSVIEIVKVKYNRIDIKRWLVSISCIINIEIFSNFYITHMIFNYNTISFRCSFVPVVVKDLYQTTSCSLHVMQLVRI